MLIEREYMRRGNDETVGSPRTPSGRPMVGGGRGGAPGHRAVAPTISVLASIAVGACAGGAILGVGVVVLRALG
jgi:hypothetical protein